MASGILAALALLLSGCQTGSGWGRRLPGGLGSKFQTRLVDEAVEHRAGELAIAGPLLRWQDSVAPGALWFAPEGQAGSVALALLRDPELCEVLQVHLERSVVMLSGGVTSQSDALKLLLRLHRASLATTVSERDLPAAVVARLDAPEYWDDQESAVFRSIVSSLPFSDLSWLAGRPGDWQVASYVFLDAAGSPTSGIAAIAGSQDPASLAERLSKLREGSLLVRLRDEEERTTLCLSPDRVWLLAQLDAVDGVASHEARLSVVAGPARGQVPENAHRFHGTRLRQISHYEVRPRREHSGGFLDAVLGDLIGEILLWPARAAADWIFGDDDEDEASKGVYESHPRRKGETEAQWRAREARGAARR